MTGDLLDEVAHEDDGVWLVTTESGSKYVLDLDAMTVTRLAAEEPVDQQAAARWYVSLPMRRDGETLPVVTIAGGSIKVGECARLVLGNVDNYDGYVSTIRGDNTDTRDPQAPTRTVIAIDPRPAWLVEQRHVNSDFLLDQGS